MESERKRGGQRSPTVVSGPLAGYSADFRQALIDRGYARRTIGDQMSMMAHLSRWLQHQCLDVTALQSAAEIDRFFAERRACGCRTRISNVALAGLLAFLREREIIGPVTKPLDDPAERLLAEYRVYLSDERGTAASTIRGFTACAAMFLDAIAVSGKSFDETLNELSAAGITRFVASWRGPAATPTASRWCPRCAACCVSCTWPGTSPGRWTPRSRRSPAGSRSASRTGCPAGRSAAVLAACDRESARGRRDYAILMLLARLGLRAAEVAGHPARRHRLASRAC